MYQAFLKLDDEIMVKDVADTVEGISFGFTDCLEVHLDSDDDDGIWVIKNGKWSILVKNREGNFFDVGKKRNLLNGFFGKFCFVRNR